MEIRHNITVYSNSVVSFAISQKITMLHVDCHISRRNTKAKSHCHHIIIMRKSVKHTNNVSCDYFYSMNILYYSGTIYTVTRESILIFWKLLRINSGNGIIYVGYSARNKALSALTSKPVKINRLKHIITIINIIIQYCFSLTFVREK